MQFISYLYIFTYLHREIVKVIRIHVCIFFCRHDECHSLLLSFGSKSLTETPLRPISMSESRLPVVSLDQRSVLMQFILLNPLSQLADKLGKTKTIGISLDDTGNLSGRSIACLQRGGKTDLFIISNKGLG